MAKTKAKTKSKAKAKATAPKKRGRPAGKTTKKKRVRRKRSSVNITRVTAELAKAGVPQSSISALLSDIRKQGQRNKLGKEQAKLQSQVDKPSAKIARVDAQLAALDGKKPGRTKAVTGSKPRKRRKKRGAAAGVKADAVLGVLSKNKGKALLRAEVAAALGVDSGKVGTTLAALLAAGKIKRTGERRGTRYSL